MTAAIWKLFYRYLGLASSEIDEIWYADANVDSKNGHVKQIKWETVNGFVSFYINKEHSCREQTQRRV